MQTESVHQNAKNSCRLPKVHKFSLQLRISGCFDQVLENMLLSMTKKFHQTKQTTSKCCRTNSSL